MTEAPGLSDHKSAMSPVKLIYFNLKGRAELARLILAQAGVEYEDCRISKEDWLALKPSKIELESLV